MAVSVEIDPRSGFCGGVIRAISRAEEFLTANPQKRLCSLGAIVHNEEELSRLRDRGLTTVLDVSEAAKGSTLLIRAHGEPPKTYDDARGFNLEIIDCTCPVVLALQKQIREAYLRAKASGGQLFIFGKVGHAEVLGLLGQVDGDALVIENEGMLRDMIASGAVRRGASGSEIFSQTTKSPEGYERICESLREVVPDIVVHDTICAQVASRHKALSLFASSHDVIVFVSGKASSNGKVLSELCRSVNPRTFVVGGPEELDASWFLPDCSVGVCGATSTPKWLLEQVAREVSVLVV